MQNDEKTWSVILSPHVPKYIQLFDNKDDFINSWTQVDSSVRSRDFHVNFILLYKLENCMTHREPVVRSRSKFLFAPDQHLDWDKGGGGIPCRTPYLSFLFASASLGKVRHFPSEAGGLSELQGLSYRGHRGLSVNSQSPGETQCYPHWPNCLHISVAFPDDIWIRKLLLNNLDSSQLTVFPINLIHSM